MRQHLFDVLARQAIDRLTPILAVEEGSGRVEYHVTDDPCGFAEVAERMTGKPLDGVIKEVALPI